MHLQRLNIVLLVCLACISVACAWGQQRQGVVQAQTGPHSLDVPYVATPPEVVDEMLRIAEVTHEDILYDLGSGDGRIVIAAARQFGARGVGVDIDPRRISEAKANAHEAGVTDRVQFLQQDLFETDIREATVVTLYLLSRVNLELRPILLRDLKPGARVVSHEFGMEDWRADRRVQTAGGYNIHFWIIPAQVAGTWTWNQSNPKDLPPGTLHLTQQFQQVSGVLQMNGVETPIANVQLTGDQLTFIALPDMQTPEVILTFSGRVTGDTIAGHVETQGEVAKNRQPWVASRAVAQ